MRVSQLIALLRDVDTGKEVFIYNNDSQLYDVLDIDELSDRVDLNLGEKL